MPWWEQSTGIGPFITPHTAWQTQHQTSLDASLYRRCDSFAHKKGLSRHSKQTPSNSSISRNQHVSADKLKG